MKKLLFAILCSVFFVSAINFAQEKEEKKEKKDRHQFEMLYQIPTTDVISQGRTGTCWSFATTSFVETELIRITGKKIDLSEMFNTKMKYKQKADLYVRYHGTMPFSPGGQAHDVLHVIKKYGFVPVSVFDGKNIGEKNHNHSELHNVLKGFLDGVVKGRKLTPRWKEAFNAILDVYFGKTPDTFEYDGNTYTPKSFVEFTGFNPDNYIEFTSYTHHPFYEKIDLEMPDNFTHSKYYNLPIDEMMAIVDNALENGYSVAFDGDMSDKFFRKKECYAVVPEDPETVDDDKSVPEKEKIVTQEIRQKAFDNYESTDDHLMHLVGIAKDQNGTKFYLTKNSWGIKSGKKDRKYKGYWYMSEQYVKLRGLAFTVHKDAIPDEIKEKLGL